MKPVVFGLLMLSASAGAAQAQSSSSITNQPVTTVTATRVAQTVDQSLADVTVITRADIDASGAVALSDLLRLQAGVDVARSGGPGGQTSVFLRGTNSNHVLVLVDGVRVASANTGSVDFSQLPLDAIQRIEIVRGPRAAYWGSDAIGGVIQIFTRKLDAARVAARYGSYADAAGSAGFGHWREDGAGYSVQVGARHVHGFSRQNPDGFSYDPDDDGARYRTLTAHGALRLGSQQLSASLLRDDSDVEFDPGHSRTREQAAGLTLQGELAPRWEHRLSLGDAREDLATPAFDSRFESRRQSITWQNDFTLTSNQILTAGLEAIHERGASLDTSANEKVYGDTRDNAALFAGWQGRRNRWNWEIAGRHDRNSEFGSATTGSAALGVDTGARSRLTASWGQGFRGPNLNEQFSPGFGGLFAGNPALRPERSRSAELAWQWHPLAALDLKLAAYHTRIDDLISFTGGETFRAENIAHARIDGAELSAHWRAAAWDARFNATWQDARNADSGERLLRRAPRKADLVLGRDFGAEVYAGLEVIAESPRADIGATLPGYALLNLRMRLRLSPAWTLQGRLENLGDRDYVLIQGFNTAGRSGWIEAVFTPRP